MDEKLKPCPFCGGDAYFDKDDESGWQWIECGRCHVATSQRASLMEDCKPLLAEAWNSRTTIDPDAIRAEARAEAMKEAVQDFEHYWKIVFGWAEDDGRAIQRLSIHQMRTLCERLVSITEHAILADEPKEEREAEGPELGDLVACRSQDNAGYLAHRWPGGLAPESYVVLMRRAEVERRIEEKK